MSSIKLLHASCAEQRVDAVVNAANKYLKAGGGICGAIFSKAGLATLQEACNEYETPVPDGEARITPSFNMKNCEYVIHAVGPDFRVTPSALRELMDAYYNSLVVLKENELHSISFPLISSSIFAGDLKDPVTESTKQCIRAYLKFIEDYSYYDVDVLLCAYTEKEYNEALEEFSKYEKSNSETKNLVK